MPKPLRLASSDGGTGRGPVACAAVRGSVAGAWDLRGLRSGELSPEHQDLQSTAKVKKKMANLDHAANLVRFVVTTAFVLWVTTKHEGSDPPLPWFRFTGA